jgi:PTH1 family peptidyl-tRNA hydrolase
MSVVVVGLGNPDAQYDGTRHNVGKDLVAALKDDVPRGAKVIELDVYMNNSGPAIKKKVGSAKNLVVVHDELDLPIGKVKISFGASAGGHNGVRSIEKALKTRDYARVRVGISPATPSGKLKRPDPEKIVDFVLGKFRPPEKEKLKKVKKLVKEALDLIVTEGVSRAQTDINAR